ncbi:hypothetical protein HDE_04439 [Halotydeus destructor]|nr:hypothetical protein HDE_04439 [Halotydeus destructor]
MDWYEAIVSLRDGFLPLKLVPYQRLKDLLVAVQIKLPSHLELAFEHSKWHMLYTLPLCKFTVEGEHIFIRLSIPLWLKDMAVKYNLIIPMTSAFPCGSEICKARPNRTDYMKFTGLPEMILTDTEMNLKFGTKRSHFNCLPSSDRLTCYNFDPNLLTALSVCTKAIDNWDKPNIEKTCKLIKSELSSYRPKRSGFNTWAVHKDPIPNYIQKCENLEQPLKLNQWVKIVQVKNHCKFITPNITIFGPLARNEHSAVFNVVPDDYLFRPTNWSGIVPDVRIENVPSLLDVPSINISLVSNESRREGERIDYLLDLNRKIDLLDSRDIQHRNKVHLTFSSIIHATSQILLLIMVILLMAATLRSGYWFTVITMTIQFADSASAYDYITDDDLLDAQFWLIVTSTLVAVIILLLVAYLGVKSGYLKIIITNHRGFVVNSTSSRFYTSLSIVKTVTGIVSRQEQVIQIFAPVSIKVPAETSRIEFLPYRLFYRIDNTGTLQVSSPITARAVDSDGFYLSEEEFNIKVELKTINWQGQQPIRLSDNSYGEVHLVATADPSPLN